ncbi:YqeG family HAD IIIA-type phosphatase [Numidum massiliense]|uniref:YqeG family HAD IIIA-type phosphatase n=1 Tax=Numidum massiliense TaxID=1522315 RepID=UPI0006D59221|nr:YqeG family HAD IIIA-type phosphatase [Numidum massiliense]
MKQLIPDMFVKDVYNIDYNDLQRRGIKAIITDLDNTLVEADRLDATPELVRWLAEIRARGFRVMIVSNNRETRVSRFAEPLRIPYIHAAKKPFNTSFRKALQRMETTSKETAVIGDQLFTDVLGGNRLGLYTILVTPISKREGLGTKINRCLEKLVYAWMKKRGIERWEE